MRELITEKMNKAAADPNADNAIVPLRPSLVSIIHEAIYSSKEKNGMCEYDAPWIEYTSTSQVHTTEPGTPAIE